MSHAQTYVIECARVTKEAFRRLCSPDSLGSAFFLTYKPHGMQLGVRREDETSPEGWLDAGLELPGNRTEFQLGILIRNHADRLPLF
jgi:hypothetical protein